MTKTKAFPRSNLFYMPLYKRRIKEREMEINEPLPIKVRKDVTVFICNLPIVLKESEANKIERIIKAHAIPIMDTEQSK